MRKIFALVLWMLIASVNSVSSQTMMDLSTLDLGIQQIRDDTFLFDSINRSTIGMQSTGKSNRTGTQQRQSSRNSNGGQPATGQTTFLPVAVSIMPQRLAKEMGKTHSEQAKLEKFFTALLEDYKEMARERKAPLNDVARAVSFSVGTCYDVYNENRLLGTRPFEAMREQMREAIARNEKFQKLDDRKRQEIYENYIITGMFVSVMYENFVKNKDRERAAKMREVGREHLERIFGVPYNQLRFTDAGVKF